MRRLLVVFALGATTGCGSLQARVGHDPKPPGIDQAVVLSLVCQGLEAKTYVLERGGADVDATERTQRALTVIRDGRAKNDPAFAGCCVATGCAK